MTIERAWAEQDLKPAPRLILLWLASFEAPDPRPGWREALQQDTGYSLRAIQSGLKALRDAGILKDSESGFTLWPGSAPQEVAGSDGAEPPADPGRPVEVVSNAANAPQPIIPEATPASDAASIRWRRVAGIWQRGGGIIGESDLVEWQLFEGDEAANDYVVKHSDANNPDRDKTKPPQTWEVQHSAVEDMLPSILNGIRIINERRRLGQPVPAGLANYIGARCWEQPEYQQLNAVVVDEHQLDLEMMQMEQALANAGPNFEVLGRQEFVDPITKQPGIEPMANYEKRVRAKYAEYMAFKQTSDAIPDMG